MKIEVTEEMKKELRAIVGAEQAARLAPWGGAKDSWTGTRDVHAVRLARLVAEAVERAEAQREVAGG